MRRFLAAFIASVVLTACTTPLQQSGPDKIVLDRDTSYSVQDRPDGFTVTVAYDRYQFVPETAAVMSACRSALLAAAYDVADRKGRQIEPVNEQRIRISTGRNGLTGITSCEASAPVEWKR